MLCCAFMLAVGAVRRSCYAEVPKRGAAVRGAAVTGIVYLVFVSGLIAVGAAQSREDDVAAWAARSLIVAVLAIDALIRTSAGQTGGAGAALMGAGTAWLVLGLVDMHVLRLLDVAHGSPVWDGVFHGLGSALFVAGWLLAGHRPRAGLRRPGRSAVDMVFQ